MEPLAAQAEILFAELLGPLGIPRHFLAAARFGLQAIQPATMLARRTFAGAQARALLAGLAAHAILPLERWSTAAVALVLGIAGHTVGWPVVRGGSQRLAESLAGYLRFTRRRSGHRLAGRIGRRAARGAGCSSGRYAQAGGAARRSSPACGIRAPAWPIPIRNGGFQARLGIERTDSLAQAERVPGRERFISEGRSRRSPLRRRRSVAASTPRDRSCCCRSRAFSTPRERRPGGHTAWAYCHVPNGSTVDMTARIEGAGRTLRTRVSATRSSRGTRWLRPIFSRTTRTTSAVISTAAHRTSASSSPGRWRGWCPIRRPWPGLYLCSSSTPPGGGVHGLCGYHAARAFLKRSPSGTVGHS